MLNHWIKKTPILRQWNEKRLSITFKNEKQETTNSKYLSIEILLGIKKEYSELSKKSKLLLKDLTRIFLDGKSLSGKVVVSCTPEGIEFDLNDNFLENGSYSYKNVTISMYPLSENFTFPGVYLHELTHGLEDAFCQLQSIRDVTNYLCDFKNPSEILICSHLLLGTPLHVYLSDFDTSDPLNTKHDFSWLKKIEETEDIQDDDGNFLQNPLLPELTPFIMECFFSILAVTEDFQKKLPIWIKSRQDVLLHTFTLDIFRKACQCVTISLKSLVAFLSECNKTEKFTWFKDFLFFEEFLKSTFSSSD